MLRHGIVPPLVNFSRPNPALAVDDSPFVLPAHERDWPVSGVRRAGVHSIGMGGTNAHVIMEQAPPRAEDVPGALPRAARTAGAFPRAERLSGADGAEVPALLPLSAASGEALVAYARSVRDHLVRRPGTDRADLLVTTALGRRLLPHRLVVTSADPVAGLDAFLRDEAAGGTSGTVAGAAAGRASGEEYVTGVVDGEGAVEPVFLFSGQGGPRPGMGAELSARFPVVAATLALCARLYEEETGHRDFLARVVDGRGPDRWDTAFAQPALFALQIAQARLWEELGVTPGRVAGHSVGEYAALCVAGAMDVEDAMRLVCRRGQLMQRDVAPGAMIAAFVPGERVRELLAAVDGLELAAVNATAAHVLAGPRRRSPRPVPCWRTGARPTSRWTWTGPSTPRCSTRFSTISGSSPRRRNSGRCARSSSAAWTAPRGPSAGCPTPTTWSGRPAAEWTSPPYWTPSAMPPSCWSSDRPPC